MHVEKRLDLGLLQGELDAALVPHRGLGTTETDPSGVELFTYDAEGQPEELPQAAVPVVEAHVAPPLPGAFTAGAPVFSITQTSDDQPKEVFRFPCATHRRYRANLTISGVDQGTFVSRDMEGRFIWKRAEGNAIMVGITVVSTLGEAASSSWAPNAAPDGTDVVFTVKGAAGRLIDWKLEGTIDVYSPGGAL